MSFHESETVEFKEIYVDEIKKEIIAFANSQGGRLYIGVRDDGTVTGIENADQVSLQLSNMIRDTIKPDLTMFVHHQIFEKEGKEIILVDVQPGTDRPYYLAKKGMRPEGVYVRQGSSAAPASSTAIRRMIKEADGDSFEEKRSFIQNLTFEKAEFEFKDRNIAFGFSQMRSLKLINSDNLYTNLGLLLSDQCIHSIKAAVFQEDDESIIKDRMEFTGSLFQQMNEIHRYINLQNRTSSRIEGLKRIDTRDYPEIAIREALLNLLVHRDYSSSASAFIRIYKNRIEFISIGGLMPGVELEDILMMGLSVCRNTYLANIFFQLDLIEAYGTGIRKIMHAYEKEEMKPQFIVSPNAFKITLPNTNESNTSGSAANDDSKIKAYPSDQNLSISQNAGKKDFDTEAAFMQPASIQLKKYPQIDDRETLILNYIQSHKKISTRNVMKLINVSAPTASRILSSMTKRKILEMKGQGRGTYYIEGEIL